MLARCEVSDAGAIGVEVKQLCALGMGEQGDVVEFAVGVSGCRELFDDRGDELRLFAGGGSRVHAAGFVEPAEDRSIVVVGEDAVLAGADHQR